MRQKWTINSTISISHNTIETKINNWPFSMTNISILKGFLITRKNDNVFTDICSSFVFLDALSRSLNIY